MATSTTGSGIESIAHDLLGLASRICLAAPRSRRRANELKELEFLTLALLHERSTMIVGDIQRLLGVLPAQMSRIIRGLEEHRHAPLIACRINAQDKRKIDVCITEEGTKALLEHQAARVQRLTELLQDLTDDEQEDLNRLVDKIRALLERRLPA